MDERGNAHNGGCGLDDVIGRALTLSSSCHPRTKRGLPAEKLGVPIEARLTPGTVFPGAPNESRRSLRSRIGNVVPFEHSAGSDISPFPQL